MIQFHRFIIIIVLTRRTFLTTQCHLPSSFFSLGTLFVASSIQLLSAECFSSKGLPTNTRSSRHGSSASFTNSATSTKRIFHTQNSTTFQYHCSSFVTSQDTQLFKIFQRVWEIHIIQNQSLKTLWGRRGLEYILLLLMLAKGWNKVTWCSVKCSNVRLQLWGIPTLCAPSVWAKLNYERVFQFLWKKLFWGFV